jgi:tetratricopeptide (TPR) repeat protein
MKKYILIGLSCLFFFNIGITQSELDILQKQYEQGEYFTALQGYLKLEINLANCINIARCYSGLGIEHKANKWYNKAKATGEDFSAYAIEIGRSEMMAGEYDTALNTFISSREESKDHYIKMASHASTILANEGSGSSPKALDKNTITNQYGVIFHNDMMYYNTDIKEVRLDAEAIKVLNDFSCSIICDEYNVPLLKGIASKANISPISISQSNKVAFVKYSAQCHSFESRRQENSIYIGVLGGETIKSVKAFPFNAVGISNTDPFLTDDGNTLYFSSNMSGGFGGYDIYVSRFDGNQWSTPRNLGPEINTAGNEITPFVDVNNNIFFASDYHFGLGGYDIFKGHYVQGDWLNVTNLGSGINSSSHDYYPYNHGREIYFTSTRPGQGGEDIYKAILPSRDIVLNFDGSPFAVPVKEAPYSENEQSLQDIIEPLSIDGSIPPAVYVGEYTPRSVNKNITSIGRKVITIKSGERPSIDRSIELPPAKDIEDIIPPPVFKIPDLSRKVKSKTHLVNYEGARLVSVGSFLQNTKNQVFFIQLGAFYSSAAPMNNYQKLSSFGNIYKVFIGNAVKVRLGYFNNRTDASDILGRVRMMGFSDAFLVNDELNTSNMELVYSTFDFNNTTLTDSNENISTDEYNEPVSTLTQEYKVRLASYEDPIWFETEKVKDLGKLEQWSKGSWTIFILSGFSNFEEAEMARISAVNRGYTDAEVVIDNGGIIERLKKN